MVKSLMTWVWIKNIKFSVDGIWIIMANVNKKNKREHILNVGILKSVNNIF